MNARTPADDIARFLESGEHDPVFGSWSGANVVEQLEAGNAALRGALEAELCAREAKVARRPRLAHLDVVSLTRSKVGPMVRGLFPRVEQPVVLAVLERSVVFLTPASIRRIIRTGSWLSTVWNLADAYLADLGAERLSSDPAVVGLSEGTTCFVTGAYFENPEPFSDYIVHEAAHVFHNCKRETVGLPATRRREWLLDIDFKKRETFAYACESYSCLVEKGRGRERRRQLFGELTRSHAPGDDRVDSDEYLSILAAAIESRAGWKCILDRCKPQDR